MKWLGYVSLGGYIANREAQVCQVPNSLGNVYNLPLRFHCVNGDVHKSIQKNICFVIFSWLWEAHFYALLYLYQAVAWASSPKEHFVWHKL